MDVTCLVDRHYDICNPNLCIKGVCKVSFWVVVIHMDRRTLVPICIVPPLYFRVSSSEESLFEIIVLFLI